LGEIVELARTYNSQVLEKRVQAYYQIFKNDIFKIVLR